MTIEKMREMDIAIGGRIKELRLASGLSRVQLAEKVGVTHQQFQKYEQGTNRISAPRLVVIAAAFGKHPAYFLDGVSAGGEASKQTEKGRMCIEVSRNFMRIKSKHHRKAVAALVKSLGGEGV